MKILLAVILPILFSAELMALKVETLYSPSGLGARPVLAISGTVTVCFKPGTTEEQKNAHILSGGYRILNRSDFSGCVLAGLPEGMSVLAGMAALKNGAFVESSSPNRAYRAAKTANDPSLGSQYALAQIQAFGAWEYETGISSRVTVAVMDTGIQGGHPDLSGKIVSGSASFDPLSGVKDPPGNDPLVPACNHGTRVAGIAAASSDNALGIAGVSWGAKIISLKIFDDSDCLPDCSHELPNNCYTGDWAIDKAMEYALTLHNSPTNGKIVLNMSIGEADVCQPQIQNRVNNSTAMMLVAAAGNTANYVNSPGNCLGVMPVAATDNLDNIAIFSSRGSELTQYGVAAPGVGVYTTDIASSYASDSGTSFSAPVVSGLAALLWSAKPSLSSSQIADLIKNSADDLGSPGPDIYYGKGRVNALKAMRLANGESISAFKGASKAISYPNPFKPARDRLVSFTVPDDILGADTEVKVYTSEGEMVRKIEGLYWDGKNDSGRDVASGVYLFTVKTDGGLSKGKMALVR